MARSIEKPLGEIIKEILHKHGLEEKLVETRIFSSWEKIMGQPIAVYTNKIVLKKSCLTVYLRSPALRNELSFAKTKIINMINDEIGKPVIREIVFR